MTSVHDQCLADTIAACRWPVERIDFDVRPLVGSVEPDLDGATVTFAGDIDDEVFDDLPGVDELDEPVLALERDELTALRAALQISAHAHRHGLLELASQRVDGDPLRFGRSIFRAAVDGDGHLRIDGGST